MAKSEFEKSAQQAAVEAVERRWQRQHDAERRHAARKTSVSLLACVVLLAGLAGIGYFAARHYGVDVPFEVDFDLRDLVQGWGQGHGPSKAEIGRRDEYARLLEAFKGKKCVPWREAPAAVKPKTAAAGVRYLALCGTKDDRRLYELVADGRGSMSVTALSPIAEPVGLSMEDFRSEVGGRPYLVLCNDVLYAVGGKNEPPAR